MATRIGKASDLKAATGPTPLLASAPQGNVLLDVSAMEEKPQMPEADEIIEAAEALLRQGSPHDFDFLVIGGGPAGCAAALKAASLGARVALVESASLGGTFLNKGGIATQTWFHAAEELARMNASRNLGVRLDANPELDIETLQQRKSRIIIQLSRHLARVLEESGVQVMSGIATFVESTTVQVTSEAGVRRIKAVHVAIAVGGTPRWPDIAGLDHDSVLTPDQVLELKSVPRSLIVLGCGVQAVELATIFQTLGSNCCVVHSESRLLPRDDEELSREVESNLTRLGCRLELDARLKHIDTSGVELQVHFHRNGVLDSVYGQYVLIAGGRRPDIEKLGLDRAGVQVEAGKIIVDEDWGTNVSGVYAVGDAIRSLGWAHQAEAEGAALAERLFGDGASHPDIPNLRCYRTLPESAAVGLTLNQAIKQGIQAAASRYDLRSTEPALLEDQQGGFINLVYEITTERLLGCQISCRNAGDLIRLATHSIETGCSLESLSKGLHHILGWNRLLAQAAMKARQSFPGDW